MAMLWSTYVEGYRNGMNGCSVYQKGPECGMDLRLLSAIGELSTSLLGLVRQFLVRFERFLIKFQRSL